MTSSSRRAAPGRSASFAFEDAIDVNGGALELLVAIDAVRKQTAACRVEARWVNGWKPVPRCRCNYGLAVPAIKILRKTISSSFGSLAKLPSELSISLLLYSGIFHHYATGRTTDSSKHMRSCQTGFWSYWQLLASNLVQCL